MQNPRLKGVVERFANFKQIQGEFWEKYQIFANYIFLKDVFYKVNEEYPYESLLNISFLEDINFGKDGTMAVDGCFLIYKKEILHLGMDTQDLEEKFEKFTDGDLNIILIQTKSGKLEPTDISTLSDCLNAEFKQQTEWRKFVELRGLCNNFLEKTNKINIKFSCIYVEGKQTEKATFNNSTFTVRVDALKKAMKDYLWIPKDEYILVDFCSAEKVYEMYEKQEQNLSIVSKTVNYINITSAITVPDVGNILFGAISFGELMKLIYDKEKGRRYELYGYNVRDEVKNPAIKKEIIKTITEQGEQFIILNNGITFIVDKQEKRGERGIVLENIRIVNGCQTCNAIVDVCKDTDDFNDRQVSMRIIETQKDEILLGNITYSSNNQNAVTKENLISIAPKIFELEKAFKVFDLERTTPFETVLFERREGQFRGQSVKYIDTLALAKAYISLWDGLPNECLMYRDEILEKFVHSMKNDEFFIKKSIIAGILWHNIYKNTPSLYDNARYHIFSVITRNYIDLQNPEISQLDFHKIPDEIQLVINAIKECKDTNNDFIFPASTAKGKIHYRKFYPPTALNEIDIKYKSLKNAPI
ncbi:MAG: AIPR family protein [Sphingobacteriales bacterium]|nr:AIPR family protein [Sphingobacteriales bacterium]